VEKGGSSTLQRKESLLMVRKRSVSADPILGNEITTRGPPPDAEHIKVGQASLEHPSHQLGPSSSLSKSLGLRHDTIMPTLSLTIMLVLGRRCCRGGISVMRVGWVVALLSSVQS